MNTTCSQCGTSYRIPDDAIGTDGRVVQCVKCSASWRQMLGGEQQPIVVAAPSSEPEPVKTEPESLTAVPLEGETRKLSKVTSKKARLLSAALLLALIILMVGALLLLRKPLVHAWPGANRFYESIGRGVKPPVASLSLRNVQSVEMSENGQTTLHVSGEIVNTSTVPISVPLLKASLLNETGVVKSVTFSSGIDFLLPQITHKFETSVDDAGIDAKTLQLSFVDQQ